MEAITNWPQAVAAVGIAMAVAAVLITAIWGISRS